MRRSVTWGLLLAITAVALVARWTGLDWDGYNHYHPDERYITWVATTIAWPDSLSTALDPQRSTLNPYYWPPNADDLTDGILVPSDEPRQFAYGHLPLYLGVAATRLVERAAPLLAPLAPAGWQFGRDLLNTAGVVEFRHLTAVARALTGLADVATLVLIFLLGRRVYSPQVGLLAAALLAVNVMHIQLAHFFISDPFLTLFVVAALYAMVGALQSERPGLWLVSAAALLGLAVGSKFTAVLLFLPLLLTIWFARPGSRLRWALVGGAVAFGAFFVTNPFAVLDFSCDVVTPAVTLGPLTIPAVDWSSCYLANVVKQNGMVNGRLDLGFTRQFDGTVPYLYFIEMQLRWGMGWLAGILAFAGFGWAIVQNARFFLMQWRRRASATFAVAPALALTPQHAILILLAWCVPYFVVTGGFYVKFMRYLQPLTPFLMLFAAALLWQLRPVVLRRVVAGVVLGVTAVYALAFLNIYAGPHPWDAASLWIYANVEPGTLIASEQWDDSLPTSLLVDGALRSRSEYPNQELTWLTGPDAADNEAKLADNLTILERAGYVTLLSNRVYGVVPRLEERYPLSSQYHQLLLDGRLGYEPVVAVTRMPGLFGLHLQPDAFGWPDLTPPAPVANYLAGFTGVSGGRFDESFTVYDQPLVIIFKNVGNLSAAEMRAQFE